MWMLGRTLRRTFRMAQGRCMAQGMPMMMLMMCMSMMMMSMSTMLLRMMLLMRQSCCLLQQKFLPHGRILCGRGGASRRLLCRPWCPTSTTRRWRRRWHAAIIERQLLGAAYVPDAGLMMQLLPLPAVLLLVVLPELRIVRGRAGTAQYVRQQGTRTWRRRWRCGRAATSRASAARDGIQLIG